jgi:hypothetical protein
VDQIDFQVNDQLTCGTSRYQIVDVVHTTVNEMAALDFSNMYLVTCNNPNGGGLTKYVLVDLDVEGDLR